jgi:hypothetical protein
LGFTEDANALIMQKKFDALEALWMTRLEGDTSDIEPFLQIAKALRKAEQRSVSDTLLGLLADTLQERKQWAQRLTVIKEIARLSKHPANFRQQIEESLMKGLSGKKSFKRVLEFVGFSDKESNPVEKADKIESWLQYDEGECFFMTGRGAGRVTELNPDLGIARLDFEKDKRVSVPLGAAQKYLTPLPEGHVLREKFTRPDDLKKEALKSQPAMFARVLQSFGRAMTMPEVRDALIGIVPEEKWSSWWTAARKNPQIVISGSGAKATYAWNASTSDAAASIQKEFDKADLKTKLDLARKHSFRDQTLADHISAKLASEAVRVSRTDQALAWQILTVLETLPGNYEIPFDQATLLTGPMASRVVASIGDKALRERALLAVREKHPDWPKVYGELFFMDDEPRMLTLMMNALEEGGQTEIRDRLIEETLRYPRRHPRAFYWYAKRVNDDETQEVSYSLVFQILEAVTSDEFAPVRARLRDFFDKGQLVIRTIVKVDNEESARKLADSIDRYGGIEDYRREMVKQTLLMKYPSLREPEAEPVYATAEMLAAKRQELEHMIKVDIPANSKAIQVAREMGDLRENFEYKAARQRAEYLAARAGELQGALQRRRPPRGDDPRSVGVCTGEGDLLQPVRRGQSPHRPRRRRHRLVHGQRLHARVDPQVDGRVSSFSGA